MASDDASVSSTIHSYISLQDEYGISFSSDDEGSEVDDDAPPHDVDDEHVALQRHHPYNSSLSRLSVCTTNSSTQELLDQDDRNSVDHETPDDIMMMMMMSSQFKSRLSLGTLDISHDDDDADEELSDFKDSEQDKKDDCYSLPATPPRAVKTMVKEYSSDNEARKKKRFTRKDSHTRRWVMGEPSRRDRYVQGDGGDNNEGGNSSTVGVLVTARPKGGRRSLCMGLEEVKACRDLGFELEQYQRISTRSSNTNADLDAPSSGSCAFSPLPTLRISSPGDDPRDVKARLKVWAQAVALASSSTCSSSASSHHGN